MYDRFHPLRLLLSPRVSVSLLNFQTVSIGEQLVLGPSRLNHMQWQNSSE